VALVAGLLLFGTGCPSTNTAKPPGKPAEEGKKHDEDEAPHGGMLYAAKPGHKLHAELLIDKGSKKATVYILDDKAKKAVPIKAATVTVSVKDTPPVQVVLKADKQEGDPEGQASRFSGTNDRFGSEVKEKQVEISAEIDGKQTTFEPEAD
jgi:hypothetical protein